MFFKQLKFKKKSFFLWLSNTLPLNVPVLEELEPRPSNHEDGQKMTSLPTHCTSSGALGIQYQVPFKVQSYRSEPCPPPPPSTTASLCDFVKLIFVSLL